MPWQKPLSAESILSHHRLEQLTDGVFSIVLTLMIFNLKLPDLPDKVGEAQMTQALLGLGSEMGHYLLTFVILGSVWVANNQHMKKVAKTDQWHLWLNLAALFLVCLVPFTSALVAQYGDFIGPALAFDLNLFLLGMLYFLSWNYAITDGRLLAQAPGRAELNYNRMINLVLPASALAAGVGAFFIHSNSNLAYLLIIAAKPCLRRYRESNQ